MIKNLLKASKWQLGAAFAPLMAFKDQEINQLYEKFKNETNGITESIVGIKRNPKAEGLGKEAKNLCKQRRNARLVHIKDPYKRNIQVT